MNLESAQAEAFLRGIPYVDEMVFHRPLIFCMSPESVRASYNSQKLLKTLSLGNLLLNFQCIKNNFFNDSEHFAQLARVVSVPVGRRSGHDVSGPYKHHYFLFFLIKKLI